MIVAIVHSLLNIFTSFFFIMNEYMFKKNIDKIRGLFFSQKTFNVISYIIMGFNVPIFFLLAYLLKYHIWLWKVGLSTYSHIVLERKKA